MSYRNPTYYGIVEDTSAFTDAFQKTFLTFKNAIDKNIEEKEKRDKAIIDSRAADKEFLYNQTKQVPKKLQGSMRQYFENKISEIDYSSMNSEQKVELRRNILDFSTFGNNVSGYINNIDQLDGIPEEIKTAVVLFGQNKLNPEIGEDDIKIGNYSIGAIERAFENAIPLTGDAKIAASLKNSASKGLLRKMQVEQARVKRDLNAEEIENIVKSHVADLPDIIKNDANDYIWKNIMEDGDKDLKKIAVPVLQGADINMSSLNYDLSDLVGNPDALDVGEKLRDIAIANWYTKTLSSDISSQLMPYTSTGDGDDAKEIDAKENFKNISNLTNQDYSEIGQTQIRNIWQNKLLGGNKVLSARKISGQEPSDNTNILEFKIAVGQKGTEILTFDLNVSEQKKELNKLLILGSGYGQAAREALLKLNENEFPIDFDNLETLTFDGTN